MRKYLSVENLSVFFIVFFGFLIRVIPFWERINESPILFYQPDNSYYVRRVLTILHNFPEIPMADIFLSYPKLSEFPSPPFYPIFLALLSFIFGLGSPTEHTVELVTSMTSVFFGAMIAIPVYLFAKKIFERRFIAIICALVATIVPLHYWYTIALAGDHHAIETFLALMSFYYLGEFLEEKTRLNRFLYIFFTFSLFLVWQGAILYLGLTVLFLFTYGILKRNWQIFLDFGLNCLTVSILILFLNIIVMPYTEFVSYGRYSFFSAFTVGLISFISLVIYFSIRKKALATIISLIISILIFWLLKEEIYKGFLFFAKKEKGFISILEMKSVLDIKFYSGKINLEFFKGLNYFYYLLFPPFLILFLIKDRRFSFIYTLFYIIFFALLSYNQRRFGYIYAPFIVISFFYLWDRLYFFKKGVLGIILILPVIISFTEGVYLTKNIFDSIINKDIRSAYLWLRNNTPKPSSNVFDWQKIPDYTVYAPWYQGYYLVHIAQRPVFTNNALLVSNQEGFIDSVKISITAEEEVFKSLLDKYNVKYIVIPGLGRDQGSFEFIRYPYIEPHQRIYGMLFLFDGKHGDNYMGNYRLIGDFINPEDQRKRVKIFEYVKGARLKAYLGKNKSASVIIKLRTPYQRIIFSQIYKADSSGFVSFTIPYSTGVQGMSFVETSTLNYDGKELPLYLSEEAVLKGKTFDIDLAKVGSKGVKLD
ncbi:MAG: hypothetical protein N2999_04550 [Proteobacteria bacterium]|nr:hypothetical protein [Pseudomonadota bacterium]